MVTYLLNCPRLKYAGAEMQNAMRICNTSRFLHIQELLTENNSGGDCLCSIRQPHRLSRRGSRTMPYDEIGYPLAIRNWLRFSKLRQDLGSIVANALDSKYATQHARIARDGGGEILSGERICIPAPWSPMQEHPSRIPLLTVESADSRARRSTDSPCFS